MLTAENLADLLTVLGFQKKGAIYRKALGAAVLEVNFTKKEIGYPEAAGLVINERQTCNFEANENFVVLECVHRLLEKGYKPAHIELEPEVSGRNYELRGLSKGDGFFSSEVRWHKQHQCNEDEEHQGAVPTSVGAEEVCDQDRRPGTANL
jgi:hypothetical protein